MNREGWALVGDDCLVQVAGKSSHLSVLVWERWWALDDCKRYTSIVNVIRWIWVKNIHDRKTFVITHQFK